MNNERLTPDQVLDLPVTQLDWGGKYFHRRILEMFRAHHSYEMIGESFSMIDAPITTLRDVVAMSRIDFMRESNMGIKSVQAIELTLASLGLQLADSDQETPAEEIVRLQAEVKQRLDRIDELTTELRQRYQHSLERKNEGI
jgi:hypothetical protein